jgi:predicted DCC family thiol-disulfide oxidoreductase YuxK
MNDLRSATNMNTWEIKLLYDGLCPVCSREVRFMRKRDRKSRLAFEDIADPSFDPALYGLTTEQVIGAMHGVLPDGSIVRGMAAFRIAYRAIGLGWLAAPTGWPILRPIFDLLYRIFARYRPRLSSLSQIQCEIGRCK